MTSRGLTIKELIHIFLHYWEFIVEQDRQIRISLLE